MNAGEAYAPVAVIFDLGGVVLESPLQFIAQFERDHGLPAGLIARLVGGYGQTTGPNHWHALERGEVSTHDFLELFAAAALAHGHAIDVRALMEGMSASCGIRPVMVRAIRALRTQGLRVAALSNIWAAPGGFDDRLETLRIEFDVFVESYRVGMRKPEPAIYTATCESLGVAPHEAIFLDDIGTNLKAARAMGMSTIKVENPAQAIEALETLLGRALLPRPHLGRLENEP